MRRPCVCLLLSVLISVGFAPVLRAQEEFVGPFASGANVKRDYIGTISDRETVKNRVGTIIPLT